MASRRIKLIFSAAIAVASMGGYLLYSVTASPVRPSKTLAQAPLNNQVTIAPAFIMAVDDSGSMQFETMLAGPDGMACWNGSSFFTDGELNSCDGSIEYFNLFPYPGYNSQYSAARAIPPLDVFGFSRSHEINPSYFNPWNTYEPWLDRDLQPYPDASITAARVHPDQRNHSTGWNYHTFDLTSDQTYGFQYATGMPGGRSTSRNTSYFPATFYLRADTDRPLGYREYEAHRPRVENACGAGCDMRRYEIKLNNYETPEQYQSAIQNFANWFQYHRTRRLAMVAAMSHSLADVNNMRVGYFSINTGIGDDVTMRNMADLDDKANLYDQFLQLRGNGGTPNLRAVNHIGSQFERSGAGAPVQYACQKNAGLLFTDGYANGAGSSAPSITLGAPFDPTPANSMAAIASQYYFNAGESTVGLPGDSPLNTTLDAGRVPVPSACGTLDSNSTEWKRLDCQSNLHVNFYGITLGAIGDIFDPSIDQDPFELNPSWPGYDDGDRSTVDDLWHATVNTRGEFINARTPADITSAMRRILLSVSSGASPSGAIALTGARVGGGSLAVVPAYQVGDDPESDESDGTDWHGYLRAYQMVVDPETGELVEGPGSWEASDRLPSPEVRRNRVYFGYQGDAPRLFNAANINDVGGFSALCDKPALLYPSMSLCTGTSLEEMGFSMPQVVDYLLGDDTNEGVGAGALRQRTTKLGDIVNSTPVISTPTDDYGYRTLRHGDIDFSASYAAYLETKANRNPMVYVGANDGMLHAFDGRMDASGGREVFAYIPATALGHMGNLLIPNDPADENDQKFQHRYYVDGPITVSDVYFGSSWKTALVGTAGAGGRSVFALDVSDPTGFSRLWEISDLNDDMGPNGDSIRSNIGHVLSKPVVVPVRNTPSNTVRWVAIFGNGYKSASGDAVLFVVDIGTGEVQMITAEDSDYPGASHDDNGLGNLVVVDRWGGSGIGGDGLDVNIRDGFADTVYAADLQGAIWKFDLRSAAPASPGRPVFVTQTYTDADGGTFRQPITGGLTAAVGPSGGVMLYFGTGSFSFDDDQYDVSGQSLYAVNDSSSGPVSETLDVSDLSPRSLSATRTIGPVTNPSQFGWYINLPAGERFVGNPNIAAGTVFMPTYVPDPDPDGTGCAGGGVNWLFGLNARTGAAGLSNVFDSPGDGTPAHGPGTAAVELDIDGTAPVRDVGVFTLPRPTAGTPSSSNPIPPDAPGRSCWMAVAVAGADPMHLPYPCGRQSWRQIQ